MTDPLVTTADKPSSEYRVWLLDFDGTVRHGYDELGRFVNTADDVVIFDEVPRLLADHLAADGVNVGITNQGGVALGHMTSEQNEAALRATTIACKVDDQAVFAEVYYCAHDPQGHCWCRKPNSGMVFNAVANQTPDIGRDEVLFVGDRPEDAETARRAGVAFRVAREWRAGQ